MIKIYTLSTCVKCKVAKEIMDNKKIPYIEYKDNDEMLMIADKYNISTAPLFVIDDRVYDFSKGIQFINQMN